MDDFDNNSYSAIDVARAQMMDVIYYEETSPANQAKFNDQERIAETVNALRYHVSQHPDLLPLGTNQEIQSMVEIGSPTFKAMASNSPGLKIQVEDDNLLIQDPQKGGAVDYLPLEVKPPVASQESPVVSQEAAEKDADMVLKNNLARALLVGDTDTLLLAPDRQVLNETTQAQGQETGAQPNSQQQQVSDDYYSRPPMVDDLGLPIAGAGVTNPGATGRQNDFPESIDSGAQASGAKESSGKESGTEADKLQKPDGVTQQIGGIKETSTRQRRIVIQGDPDVTRRFYDELIARDLAVQGRDGVPYISASPSQMKEILKEVTAAAGHAKGEAYEVQHVLKVDGQFASGGIRKGMSNWLNSIAEGNFSRMADGPFSGADVKASVRNWLSKSITNDSVADFLKLRSTVDVFVVGNEATRKEKIEEVTKLVGELADKGYLNSDKASVERAGLEKGEKLSSTTLANHFNEKVVPGAAEPSSEPVRLSGSVSFGTLTALAGDKIAAYEREVAAAKEKKNAYQDKTTEQGLENALNATQGRPSVPANVQALSTELKSALSTPDQFANRDGAASGAQPTLAGRLLDKAWQVGSYEKNIGQLPDKERQELLVALKVVASNAENNAYGKEAKELASSTEPGSLKSKLNTWLEAEAKADPGFKDKVESLSQGLAEKGLRDMPSQTNQAVHLSNAMHSAMTKVENLTQTHESAGSRAAYLLQKASELSDYGTGVGSIENKEKRQELLVELKALTVAVAADKNDRFGAKDVLEAQTGADSIQAKVDSWIAKEKAIDPNFEDKAATLANRLVNKGVITRSNAREMNFVSKEDAAAKSESTAQSAATTAPTSEVPRKEPTGDASQIVEANDPSGRKEPVNVANKAPAGEPTAVADKAPASVTEKATTEPVATERAASTTAPEAHREQAKVESVGAEPSMATPEAPAKTESSAPAAQQTVQKELDFAASEKSDVSVPPVSANAENKNLREPQHQDGQAGVTVEAPAPESASATKAAPAKDDLTPRAVEAVAPEQPQVELREPKAIAQNWQDKGYQMSPETAVQNVSEILEKPAFHLTTQNKTLNAEGFQRLVDSVANFDTEARATMSPEDRQIMARAASMLDTRIQTNRLPGVTAESELGQRIHEVAQEIKGDAKPIVPTDIEKDLSQQMTKIEGVITRVTELAKQRGAEPLRLDDSFGDSRTKDAVLDAFRGKDGQLMDEDRMRNGLEKTKQGNEMMSKQDSLDSPQQDLNKVKSRGGMER